MLIRKSFKKNAFAFTKRVNEIQHKKKCNLFRFIVNLLLKVLNLTYSLLVIITIPHQKRLQTQILKLIAVEKFLFIQLTAANYKLFRYGDRKTFQFRRLHRVPLKVALFRRQFFLF